MKKIVLISLVPVSFLAACGGSSRMTGPGSGMMTGPATMGAAFMSVSPQGGMTGVSPTAPLSFRFSGPMAPGMEQYFDLHRGGLDGPVVPMTCGWSADRATLTCKPGAPLQPRGGWRHANGSYGMVFSFTTA